MRNRISHLIAPLVLTAAVVGLTAGCSKSTETPQNLPDAATLLSQSAATTKGEKSVHLVFKVDGDKPILKVKELTGDLTTSPAVAAKGTAKINMGGSSTVDANFVVVDGDLWADALGSMMDMGPAAKIYDVSIILDPNKGLANLLSNVKNAKSEGTDTIDGVNSVRITGTLSKDAINTFAESKIDSDVPAKVWVKADGNHELTRISVDTSTGNTIEMSLSDWGKQVTVDKPAS